MDRGKFGWLFVWVCMCLIVYLEFGVKKVFGQSSPIIINHNHIDITKIPDEWLNKAKEMTIHYAHTSHGSQILTGMRYLEEKVNSKYGVSVRVSTTEGLPAQENPAVLRIYDGNPPVTYVIPEDYWNHEAGIRSTSSVVSTGNYDVSTWTWCGQQSTNSVETVNKYLTVMNDLGKTFPQTKFIYMTGHTDGTQDNATSVLKRNNDMVRNFVNAYNKILFDFEDIEKYDPDGNFHANTTDGCLWCNSWCLNNIGYCADLSSYSCAHSHPLQCKMKGQAFWWLMARLAGWNGEEGSDSGCTVSNGDTNGNGVDINDLVVWYQAYKSSYNVVADFNCDRSVNINDLIIWYTGYKNR